jgi:hypothetical protein
MVRNVLLNWPVTLEEERRESSWEEDWIDARRELRETRGKPRGAWRDLREPWNAPWLGGKLLGTQTPPGVRAGVFVAFVGFLLVVLLTRWVSLWIEHWYMCLHDTTSTLVHSPAERVLRSSIGRAVTGTTETSCSPVFTALF